MSATPIATQGPASPNPHVATSPTPHVPEGFGAGGRAVPVGLAFLSDPTVDADEMRLLLAAESFRLDGHAGAPDMKALAIRAGFLDAKTGQPRLQVVQRAVRQLIHKRRLAPRPTKVSPIVPVGMRPDHVIGDASKTTLDSVPGDEHEGKSPGAKQNTPVAPGGPEVPGILRRLRDRDLADFETLAARARATRADGDRMRMARFLAVRIGGPASTAEAIAGVLWRVWSYGPHSLDDAQGSIGAALVGAGVPMRRIEGFA